jgi:hypothetical protein
MHMSRISFALQLVPPDAASLVNCFMNACHDGSDNLVFGDFLEPQRSLSPAHFLYDIFYFALGARRL